MVLKVEDALKSYSRTLACRNFSEGRDPKAIDLRDLPLTGQKDLK